MRQLPLPPQHPFLRALTLIAAAIIVGAGLLFGFLIFVIVAGVALVLVAVVAVRLWWLRRQLRRRHVDGEQGRQDAIEGEFSVTDNEHTRDHRRE